MKLKIAWVAQCPGEAEFDVSTSCRQEGLDITIYGTTSGYNFEKAPNVDFKLISVGDIPNIEADLTILRYPQGWAAPQGKVVCFVSEQGPTRSYAIQSAAPYNNVALNNKEDFKHYPSQKNLLYLPFGCYRLPPREFLVPKKYDIISTTCPHYTCRCEGGLKAESVKTMLFPLNNHNLAVYGMKEGACGWGGVHELAHAYKGDFLSWEYSDYLNQARLYVDCTWNWKDGGYGVKLARALATGIPVIWQYTTGMELDGFEKGNQLDWSNSTEDTIILVDHYLSHPKEAVEMGRRGREWANEKWSWGKNIRRIYNEL